MAAAPGVSQNIETVSGYIKALQANVPDYILRHFADDAVVYSPTYKGTGSDDGSFARDFYPKLCTDTKDVTISKLEFIQSARDPNILVAKFHLVWEKADRSIVTMDISDHFELKNGKITKLEIFARSVNVSIPEEHSFQQLTDFRNQLKHVLTEEGVDIPPEWGDDEILEAIQALLISDQDHRIPLPSVTSEETTTSRETYAQLRNVLVSLLETVPRPWQTVPSSDHPIPLLSYLRECLELRPRYIYIRGINLEFDPRPPA